MGHYRWVICALLFFATAINYVDRQVFSILAPELQHIRKPEELVRKAASSLPAN